MAHRSHLTTLRLASGLRDSLTGYKPARLLKDLTAGLTVGIVAIPLAMALAIASGVAPQHGLYTAIIAGIVIALAGGSRFSVSGPTAAFVVILYPISQQFGLAGLLTASLLAGLIQVLMAVARLGRLIEYIPEPVTLGFTSGIAIVIAIFQIRDFFGLALPEQPENHIDKLLMLVQSIPGVHWPDFAVGLVSLMVLMSWPRRRWVVPGHLPAVLIGVAMTLWLVHAGYTVETIGTRFSYLLPDGSSAPGIASRLPELTLPWMQPGPGGQALDWGFETVRALVIAGFSIAMLGAIESLLCAVVLDGMTGKRHQANGELLGQGMGNLIVPFFGGITATAALARSVANVRAGAQSPLASVFHGLFVLAGLLVLAPWLSYLPMASMAALLLMVAWNMSEAHKVAALVRKAPLSDVLVLATCMSLTVLIDMVVAIATGIVLASLLFMRDIAAMTRLSEISGAQNPGRGWRVYKINGPLFFAAADRIFSELDYRLESESGVILYLDAVPILDAGGLSALEKFIRLCRERQITLILADLQFQPLKALARAGIAQSMDQLRLTPTLAEAIELSRTPTRLHPENHATSTVPN
ncbi:MAG: C4-dicarboxylic acid transporter DauA [Wenzhouxiangellaceae bacterium]|nr:C4-dicarboxylic acid transporter DauA [Wenzhouxiangellaceae bacterium]